MFHQIIFYQISYTPVRYQTYDNFNIRFLMLLDTLEYGSETGDFSYYADLTEPMGSVSVSPLPANTTFRFRISIVDQQGVTDYSPIYPIATLPGKNNFP